MKILTCDTSVLFWNQCLHRWCICCELPNWGLLSNKFCKFSIKFMNFEVSLIHCNRTVSHNAKNHVDIWRKKEWLLYRMVLGSSNFLYFWYRYLIKILLTVVIDGRSDLTKRWIIPFYLGVVAPNMILSEFATYFSFVTLETFCQVTGVIWDNKNVSLVKTWQLFMIYLL